MDSMEDTGSSASGNCPEGGNSGLIQMLPELPSKVRSVAGRHHLGVSHRQKAKQQQRRKEEKTRRRLGADPPQDKLKRTVPRSSFPTSLRFSNPKTEDLFLGFMRGPKFVLPIIMCIALPVMIIFHHATLQQTFREKDGDLGLRSSSPGGEIIVVTPFDIFHAAFAIISCSLCLIAAWSLFIYDKVKPLDEVRYYVLEMRVAYAMLFSTIILAMLERRVGYCLSFQAGLGNDLEPDDPKNYFRCGNTVDPQIFAYMAFVVIKWIHFDVVAFGVICLVLVHIIVAIIPGALPSFMTSAVSVSQIVLLLTLESLFLIVLYLREVFNRDRFDQWVQICAQNDGLHRKAFEVESFLLTLCPVEQLAPLISKTSSIESSSRATVLRVRVADFCVWSASLNGVAAISEVDSLFLFAEHWRRRAEVEHLTMTGDELIVSSGLRHPEKHNPIAIVGLAKYLADRTQAWSSGLNAKYGVGTGSGMLLTTSLSRLTFIPFGPVFGEALWRQKLVENDAVYLSDETLQVCDQLHQGHMLTLGNRDAVKGHFVIACLRRFIDSSSRTMPSFMATASDQERAYLREVKELFGKSVLFSDGETRKSNSTPRGSGASEQKEGRVDDSDRSKFIIEGFTDDHYSTEPISKVDLTIALEKKRREREEEAAEENKKQEKTKLQASSSPSQTPKASSRSKADNKNFGNPLSPPPSAVEEEHSVVADTNSELSEDKPAKTNNVVNNALYYERDAGGDSDVSDPNDGIEDDGNLSKEGSSALRYDDSNNKKAPLFRTTSVHDIVRGVTEDQDLNEDDQGFLERARVTSWQRRYFPHAAWFAVSLTLMMMTHIQGSDTLESNVLFCANFAASMLGIFLPMEQFLKVLIPYGVSPIYYRFLFLNFQFQMNAAGCWYSKPGALSFQLHRQFGFHWIFYQIIVFNSQGISLLIAVPVFLLHMVQMTYYMAVSGSPETLQTEMVWVTTGLIIVLVTILSHDSENRRSFHNHKLAQRLTKEAQHELEIHEKLLELLIPSYVIETVRIRQEGVRKCIADRLPDVAVLALRLNHLPIQMRACTFEVPFVVVGGGCRSSEEAGEDSNSNTGGEKAAPVIIAGHVKGSEETSRSSSISLSTTVSSATLPVQKGQQLSRSLSSTNTTTTAGAPGVPLIESGQESITGRLSSGEHTRGGDLGAAEADGAGCSIAKAKACASKLQVALDIVKDAVREATRNSGGTGVGASSSSNQSFSSSSCISILEVLGDVVLLGGPLQRADFEKDSDLLEASQAFAKEQFQQAALGGQNKYADEALGKQAAIALVKTLGIILRECGKRSTISSSSSGDASSGMGPNLSAILHREDGVGVVLGKQQPRFSLQGCVARTALGLMDAAPNSFLGCTDPFYRDLDVSSPRQLFASAGLICDNNNEEQQQQQQPFGQEPGMDSSDTFSAKSSEPFRREKWRCRGLGLRIIIPLQRKK